MEKGMAKASSNVGTIQCHMKAIGPWARDMERYCTQTNVSIKFKLSFVYQMYEIDFSGKEKNQLSKKAKQCNVKAIRSIYQDKTDSRSFNMPCILVIDSLHPGTNWQQMTENMDETLRENEKMLVTSIFSISHNVSTLCKTNLTF